MASPAALLLSLLLISVEHSSCEYTNATTLSVQIDTLLAEYDRDTPPAPQVVVRVDLDVKHAAVYQETETMRILADLKMSWQDLRIEWNASEWGTNSTLVSAEQLWLPDVVLLNTAAATRPGDDALRARISADGAVAWINRIDVSAPMAMDLTDWPHDTHTGTFKFGSRAFNSDEMVMEISEFKHAIVFETGAWEIVSISANSPLWQRGDGDTSVAAWRVRMARRAPAHAAAATAALLAAALMLCAAAALPLAQRHALAACASFTAALWLITSVSRLPGGRSCPRAVAAMCGVCACGAACGAAAAAARRLARCSAPPPRLLRTALSHLSSVCRLTPTQDSAECGSGAWAAAALLLDRALRAGLLLTLLVLVAVQLS